jgi:serine phosphatase RsbU (regulator of sigma subunit)
MRRLSESIKSATPLPLAESVEKIWNDVMQFCGGRLSDDMLLLGLEIPPGAASKETPADEVRHGASG